MQTSRISPALAMLAAAGLLLAAPHAAEAGGLLDIILGRGRRPAPTPTIVTLRDGQAVGALAGRSGSIRYFRIQVAPGRQRLTIETAGGRGDADLYVQHNAQPTSTNYLKRSASNTSAERIVIPQPTAGWWYVMVKGFNDYAGVSLVARTLPGAGVQPPVVVPGRPGQATALRLNEAVANLAGRSGSRRYFELHVPPGTMALSVTTAGGAGDSDLYLSRGSLPEPKSYQYVSNGTDTNETITIRQPAPGKWYALIYGYGRFAGVTVRNLWKGGRPVPRPHPPRPPQPARRWIRLAEPATGARLTAGQSYWVRWSTSGHTRRVQVLQSFNDGRTWQQIARTALASTGRLAWTVPLGRGPVAAATVRLRVVDADNPAIFGETGRMMIVRGPIRPRPGPGPIRPGPGQPLRRDIHEPNNSASRASGIVVNMPQTHWIHPEKDEDWLIFVPPALGVYRIAFDDVTVELKARVYAAKTGSKDDVKLKTFTVKKKGAAFDANVGPKTRHLKIQVQPDDDDDTGRYRVTIQRVGPPVLPKAPRRPARR